jgi:hypothetical protein
MYHRQKKQWKTNGRTAWDSDVGLRDLSTKCLRERGLFMCPFQSPKAPKTPISSWFKVVFPLVAVYIGDA